MGRHAQEEAKRLQHRRKRHQGLQPQQTPHLGWRDLPLAKAYRAGEGAEPLQVAILRRFDDHLIQRGAF